MKFSSSFLCHSRAAKTQLATITTHFSAKTTTYTSFRLSRTRLLLLLFRSCCFGHAILRSGGIYMNGRRSCSLHLSHSWNWSCSLHLRHSWSWSYSLSRGSRGWRCGLLDIPILRRCRSCHLRIGSIVSVVRISLDTCSAE